MLSLFRHGYIERLDRAGTKVTSFRLSELQSGNLFYIMENGISTATIGFQAWDGEQYSDLINIRFTKGFSACQNGLIFCT